MKKVVKNIAIKLWFRNSIFKKSVLFSKDSYVREGVQMGGYHITLETQSRIPQYSRLMCFENISGEVLKSRLTIDNNVFIREKAMLIPGMTIGDNCIIGAGNTVEKLFLSKLYDC